MLVSYPQEYKKDYSINVNGINCSLYQSALNLLDCQERRLWGRASQSEKEPDDWVKGNWTPLLF